MKKVSIQDYLPEGQDIEDVIESWTQEEKEYFNKEATRLLSRCDEILNTYKKEDANL